LARVIRSSKSRIAPRGLAGGVVRQEDGSEIVQGEGLLGGGERLFRVSRLAYPLHEVVEVMHQIAHGGADLGGRDLGEVRLPVLLQEAVIEHHQIGAPRRIEPQPRQSRRKVLHRSGPGAQKRQALGDQPVLATPEGKPHEMVVGDIGRQAEQTPHRGEVHRVRESRAMAGDLVDELGEILAVLHFGQAADHGGMGAVGHFLDDLGAHLSRRPVVHLGEAGGDARLQREAAEEAGAEAVDGLDAQAPGRLDGAGEQLAGAGQALRRKRALAQRDQRVAQGGLGHHRPFAQPPEQPVLHLGGGGLGVGEAEDMLRLHPAEEEARHPVGQHAGLARPGIGGKPGVPRGIGGSDLGGEGVGHAPSSEASSSVAGSSVMSHSPKRDRWS